MNLFPHSPQLQAWPYRLARMPRWAWITLGLPILIVGGILLLLALLAGLVLFAIVGTVKLFVNAIQRLFHRPADDGRRNVRIMVHSARVIDP